MKRLLLILIISIFSLSAHAQHFDWVKSYKGQNDRWGNTDCNKIIGSAVDSDGNLYILGEFTQGAQIDSTDLLPFAPFGAGNNTVGVVIAKLNTEGQLQWRKVIHTNIETNSHGSCIQVVGDTSVFCSVVTMSPAVRGDGCYTYFLDSLYCETNDFAYPTDSLFGSWHGALLELDLDGNLRNPYFLDAVCINADGTVVMKDSARYYSQGIAASAFTVDGDGNIIMAMGTGFGTELFNDSTYWGYRLLINGGERHFDIPVATPTMNTNYQLLKFAPGLTSLLLHQMLFEPPYPFPIYTCINSLMSSSKDNAIYMLISLQSNCIDNLDSADLRIAGLPDVRLHTHNSLEYAFQIKYNNQLNPQWIFQLDYDPNGSDAPWEDYLFHAQTIDKEGNVYCLGRIWNLETGSVFTADTCMLGVRNGLFFARLDSETGHALSVGEANCSYRTDVQPNEHIEIVANNNRVIAQIHYRQNLYVGDSVYTSNMQSGSTGLFIWDKEGHEVQFIDFYTNSNMDDPRGTLLHDSILYLTGMMDGGGTYGDYSLPEGYRAYMIKYVDTAFMIPYVHTEEPGEVSITLVDDGSALVAYPNPFRQSVRIKVQGGQLKEHNGTVTAILTDLSGHREQVRLIPQGHSSNNTFTQSHNQIYTLDLTSRPQATYLLTLTTASGKTHTVRLMKMSDIFTR